LPKFGSSPKRNGGLFRQSVFTATTLRLLQRFATLMIASKSFRTHGKPTTTSAQPRFLSMSMQADLTPFAAAVMARPSILQRLRFETRDAHAAIEKTIALTGKTLTRSAYRQALERFYGFYKPVEGAIAAAGMPAWLDVAARSKTAWLEADLQRRMSHGASVLPLCNTLPPLGTVAQRLGCLYVMEGATLGGVLISRHVRENLGVYPESGGRFFHGYGASTAAMWNDFRAGLLAFASVATQEEDQIIATARATFETLQRWCEKREKP
jgi:heme oxygenase (biliverdin-IX-beta and delta-forming)